MFLCYQTGMQGDIKRRRKRRPKPDMEFTSSVPWPGRKEGDPILFGYVRVSTNDQDTQRQVDELVRAGVHPLEIRGDKASGATMDPDVRPGLAWVLQEVQAGDVLVIHSLERLSRDTLDLLTTLRDLEERGVGVRILNFGMDASTPIGEFAMTIFAAFGRLERRIALERTMSGLQRAKERGVVLGSSKKFTDQACWDAYDAAGTIEAAAKRLKCSTMTIKRALARRPRDQSNDA